MKFLGALQAIRDVMHDNPQVYIVNEGANALDLARKHDWHAGTPTPVGQREHGVSWASAWATRSPPPSRPGDPVVAIEGDSAFGFSGMELEAVCRYNLPIVTVILNNSGVYRGDDVSTTDDPAPTALQARHEYMIKAFGGKGYQATTPAEVGAALREALASGRPALIDCVHRPLGRHGERKHRAP
jgi:oxalyl-CoA decarboxylase